MSAIDPVGLRLILKGTAADQQSMFKRLQSLAGVDLKLRDTGEVVFAQCPVPVRLGAGYVAMRRLLTIPQISTWTLAHGIRIDWAAGGPGDLNVDVDDFAQLDAQRPHPDKWTADDILIHELWEQWHVLAFGGGYDDARAHQKAMELENAYRQTRGASPRLLEPDEGWPPEKGFSVVKFRNGVRLLYKDTSVVSQLHYVK